MNRFEKIEVALREIFKNKKHEVPIKTNQNQSKPIKLLAYSLLLAFLFGCNDQQVSKELELPEQAQLMKETSILLGNVLRNKEVRREVNEKIREVDALGQSVSFAYLFDREGLKKNEIEVFARKRAGSQTNLFRNAVRNELQNNIDDYQSISSRLPHWDGSLSARYIIEDELADVLIEQNLQVFYPYGDQYGETTATNTTYYVSYDPLIDTQTNEAFKYDDLQSMYDRVDIIDNDFVDDYPVYGIVPIDPCDIPSEFCGFDDLQSVSTSLPPLEDPSKLLTNNVDHKYITQNDILDSRIPKIKISGKSWLGFLASHQKLRFFRATADGSTISQNSDGSITTSGFPYMVKYVRCTRSQVKNGDWLNFSTEFDPDWNLSENTQTLTVFSIHHLSGEASFDASVKSGFEMKDGAIIPSPEASGGVSVKIKTGSAKFRANKELSRRQVLASNVGPGSTDKTFVDNGV